MIDERERFERAFELFTMPEPAFDRLSRRRRRKQRNQRITAGVLGLTIALAAIYVGTSVIRSGNVPADQTQSPSPSSLKQPLNQYTEDYFVDVRTGEATHLPVSITNLAGGSGGYQVSPDGTRLLFGDAEPSIYDNPGIGLPEPGIGQIHVANLDGSGVRQLTDDPEGAEAGSWSPDGRKIVYVGGDLAIHVLEVATGETTRVAPGAFGTYSNPLPRFSPDGESILFTRGAELWTVPITGGRSTPVRGGAAASYSPDGTMIAFVKETGIDGREMIWQFAGVWLANADGSNPHLLVRGRNSNGRPTWSPDGTRIAYEQLGGGQSNVYVVDVATGQSTRIAVGYGPTWLDDDTLIVEGYEP